MAKKNKGKAEAKSSKAKKFPPYDKCIVKCACGNTFETRSTKREIILEICSNCHPFFTGKQKLVDTAGMVEKFTKRYGSDYSEKLKSKK